MDQKSFNSLIENYRLLSSGDTVITAVSGGADSTALFKLLCNLEIDITIVCVYVDHGLRPLEIPDEIEFVRQLAHTANKKFIKSKVDVAQYSKENRTSTEDAARKLRYNALQAIAKKYSNSLIAVGHTANDQAEEILFRLLRGSSLKGLAGIPLQRDNIIRPLVNTYKQEILHYLKKEGLSYCEDSSNFDLNYTRNKIRHRLIPFLQDEFNPTITTTLNKVVDILSEDNKYLDEISEEAFSSCLKTKDENASIYECIQLDISTFSTLHTSIQRRVIEKAILQCGLLPTYSHISQICETVHAGLRGKEIHLQSGVRFHISQKSLHFKQLPSRDNLRASLLPDVLEETHISATGNFSIKTLGKSLTLALHKIPGQHAPPALVVNHSKISFPLTLRQAKAGEKFTPAGMRGTKKVSRFLSDSKIDRFKRQHHPVLTLNNTIIAVMGLRVDEKFSLKNAEDKPLYIYWEDSK